MIKKYFLLALVLILTFAGGFFIGVNYSKKEDLQTKENERTTQSISINEDDSELQIEDVTSKQNVLLGYVQDFRDPDMIEYDKLTHVIFSFAHPTKEGELLFTSDYALENLQAVVNNAHAANCKVMLAVGGWSHMYGGESYDYFLPAISNPTSRANLVNKIMTVLNEHELDGVDIDFEHPRSTEDANYLDAFIKELSEQLHPQEKELSIAVHSKINAATLERSDYVQYATTTFEYVDFVNIMAYDGQYDNGYHAENLSPFSFTKNVVDYWSELFDKHDLEKEKLILGVPLYAQPENQSVKQVSYATIVSNNPESAVNDSIKMNGTTYYFNGTETIKKKTNLAVDHGFGGMMMWELGHDVIGTNSLTSVIFEELNKAS